MPSLAAHAKVNLFLHVLARETGGYHQIETLFCRIDLADSLEIEGSSAGIELDVEGESLGEPQENLVWRAADQYHEQANLRPAVRIRLLKRIPAGAGLGGGSSDAAMTLLALNDLYGGPLDRSALLALAGSLGSDVPFFLTRASLALAWGRGDRILSLPPLPGLPVIVVVPARAMPTAEAYRALAARRERGLPTAPRLLGPRSLRDWDSVARLAVNDFEDTVFEAIPGLEDIRDRLRRAGARIAQLCGSGSGLFGIFDNVAQRDEAMETIRRTAPDARVFGTRTLGTGDVDPVVEPV